MSPHDSEHYYQLHSFLLIFLNLPFTTNDVDLVTIKISKGFFYFETPIVALFHKDISMIMYMMMMAKTGRAKEVTKNPM